MRGKLNEIAALSWGVLMAPVLRHIARRRDSMPRFQRFADRSGFQIRSSNYYEPTYRESDLPARTDVDRSLPGLNFRREQQLTLLERCQFGRELREIPVAKPHDDVFGYDNDMYSFGDAEMYYNIIRIYKPARIIEIGAGNSTLMARKAIEANHKEDPAYGCQQTCIEPFEMDWLENTGVTVLRTKVEDIDLQTFDVLERNDILFIDSSHVIRPWGDVLREIHEIIPRLNSGVLVHVHDVFTPRDYPERWLRSERRLWNEQYLLEALLSFNEQYEIVCMANWLKHNHFDAFSEACPLMKVHPDAEPGAFWFVVR